MKFLKKKYFINDEGTCEIKVKTNGKTYKLIGSNWSEIITKEEWQSWLKCGTITTTDPRIV